MSTPEIREHLNRKPFVKLRLHMTDGTSFDILHPELALAAVHTIVVTDSLGNDDFLSLRHIVRLELLRQDPAPAKG